jgi:glycosyltransferase involved in cell wall biosynthesis
MKQTELLVTVLIPAYNAEKYIEEALASIQRQTYRNLEILIIDDGSIDRTNQIIQEIRQKDKRIELVVNETNLGLIKTLNKGIDLAKGKYIARMDSDDIAHPERIQEQLAMMLKDDNIDFVGCLLKVIDRNSRFLYYSDAFDTKDSFVARFISMFESPIAHPGLIIKTDVIKKYRYRDAEEYKHVEDFDMFSRMLSDGLNYKCVDSYLLNYRINIEGVTRQNADLQKERTISILLRNVRNCVGFETTSEIYDVINFNRVDSITYDSARNAIKELNDIELAYEHNYHNKSKRIKSWVNQRKLKIIKALFVRTKAIKAILLLPPIMDILLDRYTYFNIFNTILRIINSRFER